MGIQSFSKNSIKFIRGNYHLVVLGLILAAGFAVRVININYNTPFNDEAIYVVLGRLGIFQWDWWSYNSSAWMAGYPYVYPPLTALAYMTGGIVGSRMLNVLLGVLLIEAIYLLTLRLYPKGFNRENHVAGLIAAGIVAGSAVGYYVSRLATYDMPSYYFLFLGIVFFLFAEEKERNTGKWYFFAAVALILSFFSKVIVGMFLPLLLIFSYMRIASFSKQQKHYWKIYFLIPVLLSIALYAVGNIQSLTTYAVSQTTRDKVDLGEVVSIFIDNSLYVWPFYIIGTLGMFLKKQWKTWLYLSFSGMIILFFHLFCRGLKHSISTRF